MPLPNVGRTLRLLAPWSIAVGARSGLADCPETVAVVQGRDVIERGLDFLLKDAVKWRAAHSCSTCHHGTMTVWALSEAKNLGYDVGSDDTDDMVTWTKDRLLDRVDLPRDTRPGWSMVNTSALYLSVMASSMPTQDAVSADELERIIGHLLRHQEPDGSWAWSSAPALDRPPPPSGISPWTLGGSHPSSGRRRKPPSPDGAWSSCLPDQGSQCRPPTLAYASWFAARYQCGGTLCDTEEPRSCRESAFAITCAS